MGKKTHMQAVRQRRKRRLERIKARILEAKAKANKSRPTSAS